MKTKALSAFVCLSLVLLLTAADISAQQGIISLDRVNNLTTSTQVGAGDNVRFVLRFINNTGLKVDISNGFRVWSPDGAMWDSTTIDTIGEMIGGVSKFGLYFNIVFSLMEESCDGVGMDTVAVLGAGFPHQATRQLPAGYNDSALAITAWRIDDNSVGKTICIDTAFFQPGGTWKWVRIEEVFEYTFFPEFQGLPGQPYTNGAGYCLDIVDVPEGQCGTLHVPSQYATIQAAIDAAHECDTILVAPGSYPGFIDFKGKTVRLISQSGASATTILSPITYLADLVGRTDIPTHKPPVDQSQPESIAPASDLAVITIPPGSSSSTFIKGFTVGGNSVVRGIACWQSSPTITECRIIDCMGSGDGGGMWFQKCRPVIKDNVFLHNNSTVTGGALFLNLKDSSGTAIIEGNRFYQNTALNGSGIGVIYGQGAIIRNNIFFQNQTPSNSTRGGALYGGVVNDVHYLNNTLVDNSFGITVVISTDVDVRNNIIAGSNYNGFEIREQISGAIVTADYNDIWNSSGSNYYGTSAGPHDTSEAPMLAGDYTLLTGSPCIDAGDPNPVYNDPDGSRNDIGAIPWTGNPPEGFINIVQWTKASGGNDHWYGVIHRSLFWVEANVEAKDSLPGALGLGYLATITSAPENAFILNSVVAGTNQTSMLDQFWLGGRDINGQWTWITGEPFVYTNWGTGEPNNVGIETALGMWGPSTDEPGTFNNSLPDGTIHSLHRYWSVVEWNSPSDTIPTDVVPTNEWVLAYCASPKLDRGFLPPGSIITAYDPAGIVCAATRTNPDGSYGLMPIYRDDSYTVADEGCQPGDLISFRVNGTEAFAQQPVNWTKNGDRLEVCQFLTQKCREIHFHAGWNLISWDVALATDIETLIAPIRDKVDLVLGFDRGALTYDPDLVPFSTLHQVDYNHGYWFKMHSDATLNLCGGHINQYGEIIPIYPGWNLVGYWPDATWTVQSALLTVMSTLQVAIGYDMGAQIYIPGQDMYNTLTELKPGFGYWIRSSAPDYLEYFFLPTAGENRDRTYANAGGNEMASRDWMSLYGKDIVLDGQPLTENASIEVFTTDGVKVGQSLYTGGLLKFMPVYGYDANDAYASEYPKDDDPVSVFIDGKKTEPAIEWHGSGAMLQLSSLATSAQVPGRYALAQNFPNPFNPQTTISFDLPKSGDVKLTVYNLLGQKIRTLTDQRLDAGQHNVEWDGRGDNGDAVASGIYLYRLEAGSFVASKKMILLK